jgi:microcystin-dependent protein
MFSLKLRDMLPAWVPEELDHLTSRLKAYLGQEHTDEGSHASIQADHLELRNEGVLTIAGDLETGERDVTLQNVDRSFVASAQSLIVKTLDAAGRLSRSLELGLLELYGAVTSGRGNGIVFDDIANARRSWAIVAGLPDSLIGSRDSLRFVDVVGQTQVFQIGKIGTEYYVFPAETQSVSPPAEASLGYSATGHRWKNLYVKNIDASGTITGILPPGVVMPIAGDPPPSASGWLLCDGTPVSRTTYAGLFDVIGTNYGVGDGSTTFNVPDMRGRFPFGKDSGGTGSTLGETFGTKDHGHTLSGALAASGALAVSGSTAASGTLDVSGNTGSHDGHTHEVDVDSIEVTPTGGLFINQVDDPTTSSDGAHTHDAGTLVAEAHSHGAGTLEAATHSHGLGTLAVNAANPPGLVFNFIIKT